MLFKTIFPRLKKRWLQLAFIILAQIASAMVSLWLPTLNADIIDNGVVKGDLDYIWRTGGLMLAVTLAQAILSILATFFASRLAMEVGAGLRREQFRQVQKFADAEIRHFGAASLITRATNDVQQIQMVTMMTFTIMILAPIMGLGGLVMAVRQDLKLSLLLVVAVPLLAVVVGTLMALLKPRFVKKQKYLDAVNGSLREQFTGVRVIRAFVKQAFMSDRFEAANTRLRTISLSIGNLFALMFPLLQVIMGASSVAVIWFGGHLLDKGDMQVGSMFAFLNYLMQILASVMFAAMIFIIVPRAEVSARRISEVLATVPSIQSAAGASPLPSGRLGLDLDRVSVRYPGAETPVLEDISLRFEPGTTTGIIGSTGCGKTTLVKLLARQIDPTSGVVSAVAGSDETAGPTLIDLRNLDLSELRSRVAVVPQKSYLFSGTVASTVAATKPADPVLETSEVKAKLKRALQIAQAEFLGNLDDPKQLEEALAKEVSPGGNNFSGGQRQRLTIARALYQDADVLVFDDSFSALDYATDARLRSALVRELGDVASVIVAQRVATVRHADQIIVLEHGQVVGRGTHAELLDNCETYQQIVASQISADEEGKVA